MINEIDDNELIQSFYKLIPYFQYYFEDELVFTISNTERFLFVQNCENLRMSSKTGDAIPTGCAADVCLKEQKPISIIVPAHVFGVPLKTMAIGLSFIKSIAKQTNLYIFYTLNTLYSF